ncbi:hypothetical protein ACVPOR_08385 [Staphylococcus aureus]
MFKKKMLAATLSVGLIAPLASPILKRLKANTNIENIGDGAK